MKPRCTYPGCGRPSHNGFLCKRDHELLTRRLAEVPALYADLLTTLTRRGRTTEPSAGSTTGAVLVVDLDAAEKSHDLWRVLSRAVIQLRELGEKTPCECRHAHSRHESVIPFLRQCWWRDCPCRAYRGVQTFSIRGMAQWLLHRAEIITRHPFAGEFLDHLTQYSAAIWSKIDLPDAVRTITIGQCPETDDRGRRCRGLVRCKVPQQGEGRASMLCSLCGCTWRPEQWRKLSLRLRMRPTPPPRDLDPDTGKVPAAPIGSARGGRAILGGSLDDGQAVAGRTTGDHQRKLDEGLIP